MTDFLDEKRFEIAARLSELEPLVEEYERLSAAAAALGGIGGPSTAPAVGSPRAGRRGGSGTESEWDLIVVDEAHRMGAHYFGGKLEKTRRFQLGELLGGISRHLLLMTATPHSGKEEDFQLFLTLLDRDRFEGKYQPKVYSNDTSGVMRAGQVDLRNVQGNRVPWAHRERSPELRSGAGHPAEHRSTSARG